MNIQIISFYNCILCKKQRIASDNLKCISQCFLDFSQRSVKAVLCHIYKCAKIASNYLNDKELICHECYLKLNEYDKVMVLLTNAQKELIQMVKNSPKLQLNNFEEDLEPDSVNQFEESTVNYDECISEQVNNDIFASQTSQSEPDIDDLPFLNNVHSRNESSSPVSKITTGKTNEAKVKVSETRTKSLACNICGVLRKDEEHLLLHMNIHQGKTENECRYCTKKFSCKTNVIRHMQLHWNKLKYQCETCGERFCQSNVLYNHKLAHEAEKHPIICEVCNVSFKTVKTYKHHIISHRGDRPRYGCEICGKSFTEKYTLKIHFKTHITQSENID